LRNVNLKGKTVSTMVKAAAVQISPVLYSRQGTVEKVVKMIRKLRNQRAQFVTFPETVVPYYPYFSFIQAPYRTSSDPSDGSCSTRQ
jgi:aliphatic nitrilase